MEETQRKGLIKELEGLRNKVKESIGHLKKLRREIRSSVKRLERKRKLPEDVESEVNRVDQTILRSFLKAYLSILNRASENIKDGLEELEKGGKER